MRRYLATVLADRPLLVWPLWEGGGTTAFDASRNGRNGTYNGSPTMRGATPLPGCAGTLLGASKYVQSAASVTLGSSFTLEVWTSKLGHLAGQTGDINSVIGDLFSLSNGVLVRYDNSTDLKCYYANGGGSYATLSLTGVTPPANRSTHLAVSVANGGRARLMLDGRIAVDDATSGTPSGFSGNMRVGRSEDGRYSNASFGWAAIFDSALSPAALRRHYEVGAGLDSDDTLLVA